MAFPALAFVGQGAWASGTSFDLSIAEEPAFFLGVTESYRGCVAAVRGSSGNPVVESLATSTPSSGTSHTVNLPASIASGDYLIGCFATDGNPTITWPAGWTLLSEAADGGSASRQSVYYRVADGTEGATITIGTSAAEFAVAHVYRITNATGTPEVSAGHAEAAVILGGRCRCGALRPSWTGGTLFLAFGTWDASPSLTTLAGPIVYTDLTSTNQGGTGGVTLASARRVLSAPAITDCFSLVMISQDGSRTVTWPSGWDSRYAVAGPSSACRLEARTRALQSGDGATITVTQATGPISYISISFTGSNEEIAVATEVTGTSTAPNPPSLNPSGWDVEDTLWLSIVAADNDNTVSTYPANHTGYQQRGQNNASGHLLAFTTRENAAASEDPGSYTISRNEQWIAGTVAIRPVQAGAAVFSASAAASVAFVGASTAASSLSSAAAAALSAVGASTAASTLSVSAQASVTFGGSSVKDGVLSSAAAANASFSGVALALGAFAMAAQSTVSLVGASAAAGAMASSAQTAAPHVGASTAAGVLSSVAETTVAFTAEGVFPGVFSSAAVATLAGASASTAASVLTAGAQAAASFSSEEVGEDTGGEYYVIVKRRRRC